MRLYILQPTDRSFQFLDGTPKTYTSLYALVRACRLNLEQDLDYFMRKRGGPGYSDRDISFYLAEEKVDLEGPLSALLLEKLDRLHSNGETVKVVLHFCNDVQCYVLSRCDVEAM